MVSMAHELGRGMRLHLAMGPRRRLRQCSRRKPGSQRGPCDQRDEQTHRSSDCDGRMPSPGCANAPKPHRGTKIQAEAWTAISASCENGQSPVRAGAASLFAADTSNGCTSLLAHLPIAADAVENPFATKLAPGAPPALRY